MSRRPRAAVRLLSALARRGDPTRNACEHKGVVVWTTDAYDLFSVYYLLDCPSCYSQHASKLPMLFLCPIVSDVFAVALCYCVQMCPVIMTSVCYWMRYRLCSPFCFLRIGYFLLLLLSEWNISASQAKRYKSLFNRLIDRQNKKANSLSSSGKGPLLKGSTAVTFFTQSGLSREVWCLHPDFCSK